MALSAFGHLDVLLVQPGTCTHGYFPKPLSYHWTCIVLALPMMASHGSWEEQSSRRTADTENLASVFTPFISPRAFAKFWIMLPPTLSFPFLNSQFPAFLIITNTLESDLGWNPGSATVWCTLCDPRQVTSPLWASFSSSGKWGLTQCLTSSSVNGCPGGLWFELCLNQQQRE